MAKKFTAAEHRALIKKLMESKSKKEAYATIKNMTVAQKRSILKD